MARPLKDGVDYWAFDVTLLQDRKFRLIRSEFGVYGVYIALELLNLAYREHGYYAAAAVSSMRACSKRAAC